MTTISLDTNIVIFGLRQIDPYASVLLKNLFRFEVKLSAQVERELQKNLTHSEFRQFYVLLGDVPTLQIVYQYPDEARVHLYRQLGLKTGDAIIAAFCDQEAIDIFVSENRHFLQELPERAFQILDSADVCHQFGLEE